MGADGTVTPTTLGAVLASRAYMLFYVKRSLAYGQRVNAAAIPKRTPAVPETALPTDGDSGEGAKGEKTGEDSPDGKPQKVIPVNSAVGGKGVASKGLGVGGKGGHPIRGMEV